MKQQIVDKKLVDNFYKKSISEIDKFLSKYNYSKHKSELEKIKQEITKGYKEFEVNFVEDNYFNRTRDYKELEDLINSFLVYLKKDYSSNKDYFNQQYSLILKKINLFIKNHPNDLRRINELNSRRLRIKEAFKEVHGTDVREINKEPNQEKLSFWDRITRKRSRNKLYQELKGLVKDFIGSYKKMVLVEDFDVRYNFIKQEISNFIKNFSDSKNLSEVYSWSHELDEIRTIEDEATKQIVYLKDTLAKLNKDIGEADLDIIKRDCIVQTKKYKDLTFKSSKKVVIFSLFSEIFPKLDKISIEQKKLDNEFGLIIETQDRATLAKLSKKKETEENDLFNKIIQNSTNFMTLYNDFKIGKFNLISLENSYRQIQNLINTYLANFPNSEYSIYIERIKKNTLDFFNEVQKKIVYKKEEVEAYADSFSGEDYIKSPELKMFDGILKAYDIFYFINNEFRKGNYDQKDLLIFYTKLNSLMEIYSKRFQNSNIIIINNIKKDLLNNISGELKDIIKEERESLNIYKTFLEKDYRDYSDSMLLDSIANGYKNLQEINNEFRKGNYDLISIKELYYSKLMKLLNLIKSKTPENDKSKTLNWINNVKLKIDEEYKK